MDGSVGSGRRALPARARTLPGVSLPSSVVRSVMRITSSSAHSFASRLMLRLASAAARSRTPTSSTGQTRPSMLPSAWCRGAVRSRAGSRRAGVVVTMGPALYCYPSGPMDATPETLVYCLTRDRELASAIDARLLGALAFFYNDAARLHQA